MKSTALEDATSYDRPDLGGHAPRFPIVVIHAELEIHAVKEDVIFGMRPNEEFPQLEAVQRPAAVLGVRTPHRHIKTLLKPVRDAEGPFGGDVDRVVGHDAALEVGSLPPYRGEIGVYHQIENAPLRNRGIVDLNLVRLRYRHHWNRKQNEKQRSAASATLAVRSELHVSPCSSPSIHAITWLADAFGLVHLGPL